MAEATYTVRTAGGEKEFRVGDGHVLPHEHLLIDSRVWWEGEGHWRDWDDPEVVARTTSEQLASHPQAMTRENMVLSDWYLAAQELRLAATVGVALLVDLTVQGCGPCVDLAVRAANLAGVDIIVTVGRYLGPTLPSSVKHLRAEELSNQWQHQVHEGIAGHLPGMIGEIGTSAVITEVEQTSLRAAAITQSATGLAINVHVHPFARQAPAALDILERAGADPTRVAFSHLDCELDLPQLRHLLKRGCYVEMDIFGTSRSRKVTGIGYPDDNERLDVIAQLLDDGFETQILLSHDINHRNSLHANGGWGYQHIGATIIPQLRTRFGEVATDILVSANPLRLLDVSGRR